MSNDTKLSDLVRLLAKQQGLERALELYPDGVKAAAERGLKPLGAPPGGHAPLTSPAPVFDPLRFEPDA